MSTEDFRPASDQHYHLVQRFYSDRLHKLDAGDAEGWAQSFAEDGVFETNARPEPSFGRKAIETETKNAAGRLKENKIQRRHWIGMMTVAGEGDPHLSVEAYCIVVETAKGEAPVLAYSLTLRARLACTGDALMVEHETISRDDL
ncbi:nuclear transport factor 2 family protein [Amycolatopsis keratiniphila]|uniref:SnoaL-like domain-containing protein n=1 Tax=Amycolatopsis keratiniphila subsp. keratiniphila TaxID=227715 RepID=A0A1W2M2Z0_9PSEU|nr:nuclear transport factor 2 family protein [Amycolatopsis keratiniphila]ONF74388.1 hypothetical protein AVR91_0203635 [Amycolatopsis keratiniphila subsp. keratiniphila]